MLFVAGDELLRLADAALDQPQLREQRERLGMQLGLDKRTDGQQPPLARPRREPTPRKEGALERSGRGKSCRGAAIRTFR